MLALSDINPFAAREAKAYVFVRPQTGKQRGKYEAPLIIIF